MSVMVPRYTIQDLESFPDDGFRYELLDGVLLVTPAPAPLHDQVVMRLATLLRNYLGPGARAEAYARGAVEVEPNNHLEPDILVVPADEPEGGLGPDTRWTAFRRWWLAVEVSGSGSRVYDRDHKVPAYLALGVKEAWRLDLRERCLYVTRPGEPERKCPDRYTWQPPDQGDPLVIDLPSLFAGTRRD
jgi:Uma2 family endonuclease